MNKSIKIDESIDLRGVQCPMTFQMALMSLEAMDDGQCLEVFIDDGAGVVNVPRDMEDMGHEIVKLVPEDERTFRILIRKHED